MATLTKDEARRILQKVLGLSKAEGCEANLFGQTGGNLRFARNTVTTSGAASDLALVVQSSFGKRSGTATINELDDASLEKVVRRSEELARLAPEDPEFVEVLEPQQYLEPEAYFEATASIKPEFRAKAAAACIKPSRAKDLTAAGYLEDEATFRAKLNSKGLFAYHLGTRADFSVTVRTNDGTGSGFAQSEQHDVSELDTAKVAQVAIDKAILSRNPKAIEPGKYTVILEPAAALGLLTPLIGGMDARQVDEGRSYLAKPGGGSKLGEKLVDERITLVSDPTHPKLPAFAFSPDGRPQEKISWIENGVLKNLHYSRFWARKKDVKAVPPPTNAILSGGTATLEDLIQDTKKGVLVTRTWYIRMVDPQTLLLTGLTRDGTFFIENGAIAYPIKNFRFNESPVIMLNNLEALGQPVRFTGAGGPGRIPGGGGGGGGGGVGNWLVPAMKVRDFTFSSLSDAV
jgi:predicted Zn-dependent protease